MNWPVVPLRRLVDPARRITYGIVQAGEDFPGGVPYIRPVDMTATSGVSAIDELRRTNPQIAYEYRRASLRAGDVVVSIGPSYGKVMIVPPQLEGANLTQGTARVAPARGVFNRFLYWVLQAQTSKAFWESSVGGATFKALNLEPLAKTPCSFPPFGEQERIANLLDSEVGRIDKLIEIREHQIDLLTSRIGSEIVARLLPASPDASWSRTRVKYLFEFERNGIWGEDPIGDGSDTPCVRVADFDRRYLTVGATVPTLRNVPVSQARLRRLRAGDVLLEKSGGGEKSPVGFAVTFDGPAGAVCSNFVAQLRPRRDVDSRFASLLMAALYKAGRNIGHIKQTTGIQNLDSFSYLNEKVHIPGPLAQQQIVKSCERVIVDTIRLSSMMRRQAEVLHSRRQAAIDAAVNGGIDTAVVSRLS